MLGVWGEREMGGGGGGGEWEGVGGWGGEATSCVHGSVNTLPKVSP